MSEQEEWRPVPGFPDYEVSSLGRFASNKRGRRRLVSGWIREGYRLVGLSTNGARITPPVHTLVAAAFIGPRPEGLEVRHLDGDSLRNDLVNLAYGTRAENMQDRIRHGRNPCLRKTECPYGHPYDEANTYVQPDGARRCRVCHAESSRNAKIRRAFRAAGIEVAA